MRQAAKIIDHARFLGQREHYALGLKVALNPLLLPYVTLAQCTSSFLFYFYFVFFISTGLLMSGASRPVKVAHGGQEQNYNPMPPISST